MAALRDAHSVLRGRVSRLETRNASLTARAQEAGKWPLGREAEGERMFVVGGMRLAFDARELALLLFSHTRACLC